MKNRLIIGIWLLVFVWSFGWAMGKPPNPTMVGKLEAEDFSLPDLSGKVVKLSDFRGKVVFLNFWATWCPPCRAEMPSMQNLYEKLKGKDFEMLAVSLDRPGKSAVKPFIEERNYTFRVLLDSSGKVAARYGIVSIPTTYIINKEGKIVDKIIGARDWSEESTVKWLRSLF